MNHRERLEQTLLACRDRIQEEVAALIGKPFRLGAPVFRLADAGTLTIEPAAAGRLFVPVRLDGEVAGMGLMLVRLGDAIRIGGLLVMLPEVELQGAVRAEAWSEEMADTFAEVAGIVCGALSAVFKEQFPQQVRFLAAGQQVVVAGDPVPPSSLATGEMFVLTLPMEAEGCDFGPFTLALPAEPFGLVASDAATTEATGEPDATAADTAAAADQGAADKEPQSPTPAPPDSRRLAQRVMADCLARTGDAVGNLLGGSLGIVPERQAVLTREEVLAQAGAGQVLARLTVGGEGEGEACVLTDLPTAAALGGGLLMLPEDELATAMRADRLDQDLTDAYAEVITVIASACTAVFAEQDTVARLRFDRGTVATLPADNRALPAAGYCLAAGRVAFAGRDLGRLQLLVPAHLLGLELPEAASEAEEVAAADEGDRAATAAQEPGIEEAGTAADDSGAAGEAAGAGATAEVLLFSDDREESERILAMLARIGSSGRVCHFKDPVHAALAPGVRMVVLVMGEVSEQGFGVAIKLASAGLRVPLVAAGPAWTRSLVLQAVKYGVSDVLVTPVAEEDLRARLAVAPEQQAA